MTPTGRSLALLRSWGYTCEVVERWIPRLNIRRDLLHCADVLAFKPGEPILLVQVTSASNVAARLTKAKGRPELAAWLKCDATAFEVHGWCRRPSGKWEVRRVAIKSGDCEPVELSPRRRAGRRMVQASLFDT